MEPVIKYLIDTLPLVTNPSPDLEQQVISLAQALEEAAPTWEVTVTQTRTLTVTVKAWSEDDALMEVSDTMKTTPEHRQEWTQDDETMEASLVK